MYEYICVSVRHMSRELMRQVNEMKLNKMKFIVQIGREDARQNKLANKHNLWRTLKCQHIHNIHS